MRRACDLSDVDKNKVRYVIETSLIKDLFFNVTK